MRSRYLGLVLALALASAGPLSALGKVTALQMDLGVVTQLNLDSATTSSSTSLITNVLGVGAVMPFSDGSRWALVPTVDLYWAYFGLVANRAVAVDIGDREAFVLGAILSGDVMYSVNLPPPWKATVGGGLAINARVGFQAVSDASMSDVRAINTYFWSQGRFLMPATLARVFYTLTQHIDFGFTLLAYWPIFNIWAGSGVSFFNEGIYGGSLVVRYQF